MKIQVNSRFLFRFLFFEKETLERPSYPSSWLPKIIVKTSGFTAQSARIPSKRRSENEKHHSKDQSENDDRFSSPINNTTDNTGFCLDFMEQTKNLFIQRYQQLLVIVVIVKLLRYH